MAPGDGFNTDGSPASFEPTVNDYSQTGVLEMDCLMCHLKDYSWEERKKAVRTGKFDASRVTGAHLALHLPRTALMSPMTRPGLWPMAMLPP
ncbi:hypothetical protein [Geotalea toluenoxydans]|uniref:hypothetical protein n=1 Tax=Geotalea toluenoxydans TaxID=421624 RepID=UPI000AD99A92|nr:hypothetical protein [Geotalea toluenoxydans]